MSHTLFPSNRTPQKAVTTISRAFSILSTHRCLTDSVYYNVKGIIGDHWSTWLSDCAANAETLPQLQARCALCRSVYLCGRPRALRDPAQNMPIKRARRAPSSFRGDIFQSLGKT